MSALGGGGESASVGDRRALLAVDDRGREEAGPRGQGPDTEAEHAIAATLRLELASQPVRVIEIAPGMVQTEEFSLNRYRGDAQRAASVYAGVREPLTDDDVADTVVWSVTRPSHVNVDLLVLRPRAQAAQHKVHREFPDESPRA